LIAPSGKVYQAGTYNGNPISVAAGLATLRLLRRRKSLYADLDQKCATLVRSIEQVAEELGLKMQVNHVASMFQMFLTEKPVYDYTSAKTADNNMFMKFQCRLLQDGVFLPPSQFETCFVSCAHSDQDIRKTVLAVRDSLRNAL